MTKYIMFILFFTNPLFSQDKPLRIAQGIFISSVAMDFYSGARLDQSKFHEVNIMGQNRAVQIGVMGGTGAFIVWGSGRIWKEGGWKKKLLAIGILAGGSAAHGWAAGHNWRLR